MVGKFKLAWPTCRIHLPQKRIREPYEIDLSVDGSLGEGVVLAIGVGRRTCALTCVNHVGNGNVEGKQESGNLKMYGEAV